MTANNPELLPKSVEPVQLENVQLIEKLLEIGVALSGSYDLGELLNLILSKSREITCSDAGSVYLVDLSDNQPKLLFKAAQNASRPFVSFREFAIPLTDESLAGYVALTGESLNIPDAYYLPPETPYHLNRNFDQDIGYRTRSVLVLPMRNRHGETIGVLQLLNRKKKPEYLLKPENVQEVTQPFSEWEERIVRSLASQAGISIERNHLQESIENLFEEFVKSSVHAIEARDPATSGRSERVSRLAVRLSKEVNEIGTGPLRLIHFNRSQLREIRYAALLYDAGKISVPEAILTKAKKLYPEQLNTIHQRFSLVRQTLELECAQQKYQHLVECLDVGTVHSQKIAQFDRELAEAIAQLEDNWQLVVQANDPNPLSEEQLAQLQKMAQCTYRGLDGQLKPLLSEGELEQLSVPQGTLTTEERLAMEAHVTYSYEFLKQIPWTKDLENVPAIALTHHEKLDGSGYPQGLKQEKIPIQAQILAIADIYDALTAGDRPHKTGFPVNVALSILRQEAKQHKINADLLKLFEQIIV